MSTQIQDVVSVFRKYDGLPFAWDGTADCCTFAAELLQATHGVDYLAEFHYSNKAEAFKAILEHGDLYDAICSVFGPSSEVDPADVQLGDLLLTKQKDGTWIPGVVFSDRQAVRTETGIMDWPVEYAQHMWRPSQCHKR